MPRLPAAPRCPRCGYDQSGAITAWTDACPVRGECTECGLGFPWRDVLNEHYRRLPWLFEHAQRHKVRALARTLALAMLPARFFRILGMRHEVRTARLWKMVLAVWLLAHGALAGVAVATLYFWHAQYLGAGPWRPMDFVDSLARNADGWEVSIREMLLAAVLVPWSIGSMGMARGLAASLAAFIASPTTSLVVFQCAAGLTLALLPDTRQRAKVRLCHIARAAAYPLAISILFMTLAQLVHWGFSLHAITALAPDVAVTIRIDLAIALAGVFWSALWWHAACTKYMRLPAPGLVATIIVLIGSLAATTAFITAAVTTDWWWYWR